MNIYNLTPKNDWFFSKNWVPKNKDNVVNMYL